MDRSNHYEAAFEAYLQWHRLGYIAVDESRRSLLGDTPVKSLDFLVFGPHGARLVVDVKGRRFPTGAAEGRGASGNAGRRRTTWTAWSAGPICPVPAGRVCSCSPITFTRRSNCPTTLTICGRGAAGAI